MGVYHDMLCRFMLLMNESNYDPVKRQLVALLDVRGIDNGPLLCELEEVILKAAQANKQHTAIDLMTVDELFAEIGKRTSGCLLVAETLRVGETFTHTHYNGGLTGAMGLAQFAVNELREIQHSHRQAQLSEGTDAESDEDN